HERRGNEHHDSSLGRREAESFPHFIELKTSALFNHESIRINTKSHRSYCHSERSEAVTQWTKSARPGLQSRIDRGSVQRRVTEMFENLASCFAFRCSASFNMTAT